MVKNTIAYCGLDCEKCDARIATITNDDALREKVAKHWSQLNNVEITKEMINCLGCKSNGVKTYFCEELCEIRKCAAAKEISICSGCADFETCDKLKMITDHSEEAKANLMAAK
ncbi:MAG TPA: DUF3795 domain-containing protein [Methanocorpusculum sp.]|nr:DUF3795 domain-containing protein [Methanocorpusculum sp.]